MPRAEDGDVDIARPIRVEERSGVLHPRNLERYHARLIDPAPEIRSVVDQFWHVRWRLEAGESIDQRIIESPAITLTIEEGDVPAPLVLTGVHGRAWMRSIAGSGSVFAVRLRPAGLAVLGDLTPQQVADATVPVTPALDGRLHALLARVAACETVASRIHAATEAIREHVAERPPGPDLLLANAIVDELISRVRVRAGRSLADEFGVSERTVQRALRVTLGRGPKWISRRIRLQEVVRTLSTQPQADLATIASDLGYSDQAHLINDFRGVTGITPGSYLGSLRTLAGTDGAVRAERAPGRGSYPR